MAVHISRWFKRLPPRDKQSLLTLLIFLVVLIFFVVLTAVENRHIGKLRDLSAFPGFTTKLGLLAVAVVAEAEAAIEFSIHPSNEVLFQEMVKTQAATDEKYRDSFTFVQDHETLNSWNTGNSVGGTGTIMTRQGFGSLLLARSQLALGEVVLDSQRTRARYLEVIRHISNLMGNCALVFKEDVDFTALIVSNSMMGVVTTFLGVEQHMQLYHYYAAQQATNPAMADKAVAELKSVLLTLLTFQSITNGILRPVMELSDVIVLDAKASTFDLDGTIHTFLAEATKQQFLPDDFAIIEHNSFAAVRKVMLALVDSSCARTAETLKASINNMLYVYVTFSILCGVAFVASAVEFLHLRVFKAKGSAVKLRNAGVMHDVLVRMSEFAEEIATFSLAPKPAPLTMADRKVSIVEMEMMYLLGTLKTAASALPPLLFPDRLRALAAEYSDVKDPATMVLAPAPREDLRDEKVRIQSAEEPHPFLASMADKTDLQERICEAALMVVSLTAFHDLGSAEKCKFTVEYYQKVVSIVEECVYQHGGVLQCVSLDRAVAVWNVESDRNGSGLIEDAYGNKAGFCELAATCGLALASRLNILRAQKPLVRENFPLHIGIVGGTVNVGIFGSEAAKTIGVFGPPALRGMLVAQANGFHKTSVACDDYVCRAIQRMYLCKPIELLPSGGCAYQILSEATRDESDLEMQLLTYTKAFELFERKHYKGALKAFRAYTKQYGYDSSVERIQLLITNMQM